MNKLLRNERGAALITIVLAITVVSIILFTISYMQVNNMKSEKKHLENMARIHEVAGYAEYVVFKLLEEDAMLGEDETSRLEDCILKAPNTVCQKYSESGSEIEEIEQIYSHSDAFGIDDIIITRLENDIQVSVTSGPTTMNKTIKLK